MTTPKQKSLPVLIHELDAVFSRFIRTRDTKDGVIRCFICGAKLTFQEAQVMHFIDRVKHWDISLQIAFQVGRTVQMNWQNEMEKTYKK